MSVAFQGTETSVLTFLAGTVTAGYPVSLSDNNKVANAASGEAPIGVALNTRSNHAAVQLHGFLELEYSGATAPALGWNSLVADGSGGLRLAATNETGRNCLVVSLDTTDKIIGLFL